MPLLEGLRLPDFLIIGCMKCGTTTLFRDLCAHPRVFMPENKEPHNLCHDEVLTDAGLAAYAALFKPARADQICGEASTGYTKVPHFSGATERAMQTLGEDLKLIYIVREPVSRIISHHYHQFANARTGSDIARTLREDRRLLDYTRYATQIEPWLEAFGWQNLRVIRFEDMIADRRRMAEQLFMFLGLDPSAAVIDADAVHNKGEGKAVPRRLTKALRSGLYRNVLRTLAPAGLRRWAKSTLLPKAPPRPAPPDLATVEMILEELGPEVERLGELLDWPGPVWDLEAVWKEHAARAARTTAPADGAIAPVRTDRTSPPASA